MRPQTSTDLNQHSQGNQVCHRKTSSLNVTRDARALYCRTAHLHLFVYITITFMMSRNALRHCHVTSQLHGFLEPIRTERRIILQGSIDPQCRWDCAPHTWRAAPRLRISLRYSHRCIAHTRIKRIHNTTPKKRIDAHLFCSTY